MKIDSMVDWVDLALHFRAVGFGSHPISNENGSAVNICLTMGRSDDGSGTEINDGADSRDCGKEKR